MLQEQEYVGLLIGAARRSIKQAVQRAVRPLRLTPPQFWFLNAARGLLKVEADPRDRRVMRVALAPAGVRLAQRIAPIASGVRAAVVQRMSAREQEMLRAALRKVVRNLDEFAADDGPAAAGGDV